MAALLDMREESARFLHVANLCGINFSPRGSKTMLYLPITVSFVGSHCDNIPCYFDQNIGPKKVCSNNMGCQSEPIELTVVG